MSRLFCRSFHIPAMRWEFGSQVNLIVVDTRNDLIDDDIHRTYFDLLGVKRTFDRDGFLLFRLESAIWLRIHIRTNRGLTTAMGGLPAGATSSRRPNTLSFHVSRAARYYSTLITRSAFRRHRRGGER